MFEDSLFGDLDVASAADDPFSLPVDTYLCTITKAERAATSATKDLTPAEQKMGLKLEYTVTEGAYSGNIIQDWKEIPKKVPAGEQDADYLRKLSFLKQRILSFGVPESRINGVKPEELLGTDIVVTLTKSKKDNTRIFIQKIVPADSNNSAGVGSSVENPFA